MPNRMLRDWTNSEKVDSVSFQAEVFFARLIMKVDDYGCFYADPRLLKANLFPLRLDKVREADLTRWVAECHKAGLIVLYQADNQKKYLQINDFRQRLDKAKAKFPLPSKDIGSLEFVNDFPPESESRIETELNNRANALVVASDDGTQTKRILKKKYEELTASLEGKEKVEIWNSLRSFISNEYPDFPEPFVDIWNIFSITTQLPKVELISDSRRKKFSTRIQERPSFDFLKILEKIKRSGHLKGDNQNRWKVSFDWVIDNDKNYLKILEGNYD